MDKIIYSSGDLFLGKKYKSLLERFVYGSYEDTIYITYWSVMHFISGVIVGYIYLRNNNKKNEYFKVMLIIHTLWELWQILIGMSYPYKIRGHNNIFDIILDTIFFMLGSFLVNVLI